VAQAALLSAPLLWWAFSRARARRDRVAAGPTA
jgi:hypothetical protein